MKKLILIMVLIVTCITQSIDLSNGRYVVIEDENTFFWSHITGFLVQDGEIKEIFQDRVNNKGILGSEDNLYSQKMFNKIGISPKIYSKKIGENFLKANNSLEDMDDVAGATISMTYFKKQMQFLLDQKEPGEYVFHE